MFLTTKNEKEGKGHFSVSYLLCTVTVLGAPTFPAYNATLADEPASNVVSMFCGALKYTIAEAPGARLIGPLADVKQSTGFVELELNKFSWNAGLVGAFGHVATDSLLAEPVKVDIIPFAPTVAFMLL
jgi:hypothetical protein